MIIAQQERDGHLVRHGQYFAPGFLEFGFAGFGNSRGAPVQKQFDVFEHFFRMIRAQTMGNGLGMLVQGNQNIGRQGEKFFRLILFIQQMREGGIAKILQQQEAVGVVPGENGRRAEAELKQMFVNPDKRRDGCQCLRGVHEDCALIVFLQAEIFTGGSIAGERFAGGKVPAGGA